MLSVTNTENKTVTTLQPLSFFHWIAGTYRC